MESMQNHLATEKRKFPRIDVQFPLRYSRTNLIFKYGRAANASEGGLLVYLPEEVGIGQRLAVKLFFPSHSEFNTLETSVQVVWMDIHLRKDWTWDYRTGVRFVDLSPEDMTKLKDYLVNIERRPMYTA
jgi:hypothetical protein